MWALLGSDNKTVVGAITPDITIKEIEKNRNGAILIMMTLENSPAYSGGEYRNGKFYPPKGNK
jgi:hypothetical protein